MTEQPGRSAPASFGQERLWFLAQLAPDLPAYRITVQKRLSHDPEPDRLNTALAELVARHEALRTRITQKAGKVVQIIAPAVPIGLARSDLRHLTRSERELELGRLARQDGTAPLALDSAPLWRARLVRMAERDWRFIFVIHRAVCDRRSCAALLTELADRSGPAARSGSTALAAPATLAAPAESGGSTRFTEFAAAQRAHFHCRTSEPLLGYWRSRLAGLPVDSGLPTDRPRTATRDLAGAEVAAVLPDRLVNRLAALAARTGNDLETVLLAGLTALLARYTSRSDIVIGWQPGGTRTVLRAHPGSPAYSPKLIGPLENPLVLRTAVTGTEPFDVLLTRVSTTIREALWHAEAPFELLVEELADRDPGRPPLYQVGFRLAETDHAFCNGTSELDLDLTIRSAGQGRGWRLSARYDTGLFDETTVVRFAAAFRTLLADAVSNPDRPVSALRVLPRRDAAQIVSWNNTNRGYPEETIPCAVLDHAEGWPDAGAVGHEGTWCSYRQLAASASRIAHWLGHSAVAPGQLVGVCLPRGQVLVQVLLGVLTAGAGYAPFEPDSDPRWLARHLADLNVRHLVTTTSLARRFPAVPPSTRVLLVDSEQVRIAAAPVTPPRVKVSPDSLACALLSTDPQDRDRRLGFSHRALLNQLNWLQEALALSATDRVLHRTGYSFDASALELFWPLLAGAGVVVAAAGRHNDLGYLSDLIDRERITVAQFPPNLLEPFLELPELLGLDRVICSGEPLSAQLAARCFERLPGVRLYTLAGVPGAAGCTLWHPCVPGETTLPAGRPIANTRVEILDRSLRRVPIGVVGELHVGGAQLTTGFLGQPGLTIDRVVDRPSRGQLPGDRFLRTGLLARWRGDGEVEYLGRITEQLLVRGARIDPLAVRATIERHQNVHRAEVTIRDNPRTGPELIAHVRWTGNPDSLADALRRYLKTRLPATCLPAELLPATEFPTRPDGRLDQAALAAPGADPGPAAWSAPTQPRTALERQLCELWCEVLGRTEVGVTDDFFALGGTSMLAVRLLARISDVLAVDLPLRRCFELSTVAEYALAVLQARFERTGCDIEDLVNAIQTWGSAE